MTPPGTPGTPAPGSPASGSPASGNAARVNKDTRFCEPPLNFAPGSPAPGSRQTGPAFPCGAEDMAKDGEQYAKMASRIRAKMVAMSHAAGTPHLGSGLSCVDILVAAYWGVLRIDPTRPSDPLRDRFILSKGHAISALYATLAYRGYFDPGLLDVFNKDGTNLPEQPSPGCLPGVEVATGSLGHGLGLGAGMALAGRIQKRDYRVYVLMSDGECNEGSVWESAMFAAARQLGNLATIVDFNGWQATDRSREVLAIEPLAEKFRAFGWESVEVDGHDPRKLAEVLRAVPEGPGKPLAVIAHTVKGKGVSFMEDDNNWHYRVPSEAEVAKAWAELGVA
ncbi:MAG: transketolase [Phycisphaeraceae bacterium]|nr:transketolase [Phycisphaeraceae bacterium]